MPFVAGVIMGGRFVQHVLPDGFHKIRHAGLYASPVLLEQARALLLTPIGDQGARTLQR